MKPLDPPLLSIAAGALALRMGATDLMYRYLRPSMRLWLLAAGGALVLLGASSLVARLLTLRRAGAGVGDEHAEHGEHEHAHHATWLCWLLLVPVILGAIVDPRALGAASVQLVGNNRIPYSAQFDLAQYLATHSSGGQAPQLTMAQFIGASRQDSGRTILAGTDVRLIGFVVQDPRDAARHVMARLQVGCCAADAIPLIVEVTGAPASPGWPAKDQWIEVTGALDTRVSAQLAANEDPATLGLAAIHATDVRLIDAPTEPYEYP